MPLALWQMDGDEDVAVCTLSADQVFNLIELIVRGLYVDDVEFVSGFEEFVLYAGQNLHKKVVGHDRNHHCNDVFSLTGEGLGENLRVVSHFVGNLHHALFCRFPNRSTLIKYPGNGRNAHICSFGDVINCMVQWFFFSG